jgi:hypothetical protein
LAFSPKIAPISKKHGKQGMEPPLKWGSSWDTQ